LGVDGYIVKPVESEKFAATVEKLGLYSVLLKQGPEMQAEKPGFGKQNSELPKLKQQP
jgi:hypothetical protein